ncbi:MAG TPA: hypothetical protein DIS96_09540 [Pusillimonas sp.]|nr:hypothetical protein [Pusillimonas sp.]
MPTRPGDAIVGITLAIGILLSYLYLIKKSSEHKPTIPAFLLVALIGSFCGPLVFIAFNLLTFGNVFGGYIQVASSNGFFPADIVEKFVSVWLDGFSLYGEPNSGLMQHYPWLIIGLSGLVWVMLKGDFLLKTVSSAIIVLFALYLPYSDLLPNGLWRYLNIHYFKWTFPFFGLFAAILIKDSWQYWRKEKSLLPFLSLLFIPIFLKSIGFTLITEPIFIENNKDKGIITATLPEKRIDFIDLSGVKGGFNDIYFGDHKLSVDGVKLNKVKDYRLIPQKSNVRLLFVRPIIGHSLTFSPDENLEFIHKSSTAQAGIYKLTVNPINIFQQQTPNTPLTYYNLNTPIDFSINGDSELFTTTGWSPPESWGRWSIGEYAKIQMLLSNDDSAQQLHLELSMNAFVNDAHPCQKVKITVNQKELAEEELCAGKGGHMATLYRIPVDRSMIKPGEPFNVVLSTPNSISPKQLGLSSDSRQLGIGLRYLNVTD